MPDPNLVISQLTVQQAQYLFDYALSKATALFLIIFITIKFISVFRFGKQK